MKKAILLVDGENFLHKVKDIIKTSDLKGITYSIQDIKLRGLIEKVFENYSDIEIVDIRYYCARLRVYEKTKVQSEKLIKLQRKLKNTLEKQNIKFIYSGNVTGQEVDDGRGKTTLVFKEKGVDVGIAVDMVTIACDKKADTVILCSSDSDLQPAVKESRNRGMEIIYLGFSMDPNQGLVTTTNQTILFRNPEVVKAITQDELSLSDETN